MSWWRNNLENRLHYAVSNNNLEQVIRIVAEGKEDYLDEALALATTDGHSKMVEEILKHPNITADTISFALSQSSHPKYYNGNTYRLLLNHTKTNVNIPDKFNDLPLEQAARRGNVDAVQLLLARPDTNVNLGDPLPLIYAVKNGHIDIVRLLLNDPRININGQEDTSGTALHVAVEQLDDARTQINNERAIKNFTDIIKILLNDPRMDKEIKNSAGETAYQSAMKSTKKIFYDPSRAVAELAQEKGIPPKVSSIIHGYVTGFEPSMENYDTNQFKFRQQIKRDELKKEQEKETQEREKRLASRNIKKPDTSNVNTGSSSGNTGGRKTQRKRNLRKKTVRTK
jgi:ankyrin repeat protein